ncbi:MAG: hypothetical protein ABSF09_09740 [Candidatus Bathyarchaeia archaeon]|jgi:hypothetical protein
MTIQEDRDSQLTSWLMQTAKSLKAKRQHRERIDEEKFRIYRAIPYEDVRASLEARENQETLERTINEFDAKYNAHLQLAQQKLLGDTITRCVDEKKRQEHDDYLAMLHLIIMATRRS